MAIIHLILDCYFAAILGVSGLAKAERPALFAQDLKSSGLLPRPIIPFVGYALPWVEIILAGVLALGIAAQFSASIVLVLFTSFLIIQIFLFKRGQTESCGCYGTALRHRVDGATLVTSAMIIGLAVLHLISSREAVSGYWALRLSAASALCGIGGWLMWRTIRRHRVLARYTVPPNAIVNTEAPLGFKLSIGQPVPFLTLTDIMGESVDTTAWNNTETIVLFWNPQCGFCQQILNDIRVWEGLRVPNMPSLVIVSVGTVEENRAQGFRSLVLLDANSEMRAAYGATGTPMAVVVSSAGTIATDMIVGAPSVLSFLSGQSMAVASR